MKKLVCSMFGVAALSFALANQAHADDELVEKAIKIIERMANDADANKPDCDKIGAALSSHLAEDAAVMEKVKAADAGKSPKQKAEERKAVEAKYGDRMKAAKAKGAPLGACKKNEKVKAYMTKVMG